MLFVNSILVIHPLHLDASENQNWYSSRTKGWLFLLMRILDCNQVVIYLDEFFLTIRTIYIELQSLRGDDLGFPYLVACALIMRGTWRANSETGVRGHFHKCAELHYQFIPQPMTGQAEFYVPTILQMQSKESSSCHKTGIRPTR